MIKSILPFSKFHLIQSKFVVFHFEISGEKLKKKINETIH